MRNREVNYAHKRPRGRYSREMFKRIPQWLALGATPRDIAAILGTTEGSLAVMCSRRGISLARSPYVGAAVTDQTLRKTLSPDQVEAIYTEARRRHLPVMQLVLDLVAATAQHDLFRAVLGDNDGADGEVAA